MSQTKVFWGWIRKKPLGTEWNTVQYSSTLKQDFFFLENTEYLFVMREILAIILNL